MSTPTRIEPWGHEGRHRLIIRPDGSEVVLHPDEVAHLTSSAKSDAIANLIEYIDEIQGSALRLDDSETVWVHTPKQIRKWLRSWASA